jgi:hypothetical protein
MILKPTANKDADGSGEAFPKHETSTRVERLSWIFYFLSSDP